MTASRNFPLVQIDHARYWRGAAHAWSTRYFVSGTTPDASDAESLANALKSMEDAILYPGPANSAGFLAVRVYGTGTGAPIYTNIVGTLDAPTTWGAYSGDAWSGGGTTPLESVAETALRVKIPVTGLSSTGKPVFMGKWYHSVPQSAGSGADTSPDVSSTNVTSLQSVLALLNNGDLVGGRRVISPNGRLPSTNPVVEPWYGNHQMPQGKRKKKTSGSIVGGILEDLGKSGVSSAISSLIDDF